jgi:hypothetical protein
MGVTIGALVIDDCCYCLRALSSISNVGWDWALHAVTQNVPIFQPLMTMDTEHVGR